MKLSDALLCLAQIDAGAVTVTPERRVHDCYGDNHFSASNGWVLTLFCDGGFDYIESMKLGPDSFESFDFADPKHVMGDGCEMCCFSFYHPRFLRERFGFTCEAPEPATLGLS